MSSGLSVSGGILDAQIVEADMLYLSGSPFGPTSIDGMINEIYGDRLMLFHPMGTYIDGGLDVMTGDTALGGNLTVSGTATMSSGLTVSGGVLDAEIVDADMLYLSNSPYGPTSIDGMINEIYGDRLMLFHPMGTYIDGGLDVMTGDTTLGGNLTVSGNATVGNVAASGLDVSGATTLGSVSASGAADFSSASSVTVPEPSADSEAATKLYVDAALDTVSAPGLVKVALTSNVALTAAAKEQQSVTLAAGDLVLLTGQTSASENGVYTVSSIPESESSVALTRASSLDSAEEFASGSFVFVEKGTQAGQGYVLAEVASDFALGTSSVSYSQFTIDASALGDVSAGSVAASGLNVSGTATMSSGLSVSGGVLDAQIVDADIVEADMLSLSNSPYGPTRIDGFFNDIYGERLTLFHPMGTSILGGDLYVETNLTVSGTATMGGLSVSGGLSVMSGDTTLSGNLDVSGIATLGSVSSLNVSGTATMSSGLTVSGGVLDAEIVDADMLSLSNSPYGPTRIDGFFNDIYGERLTLFHPMGTYIDGGGLDVMTGDTTLGGNLTVSGNATVGNVAASGLDVSGATTLGSVSASGAADFSSASSVTVPEPSADSEAATKLYVDAALDTVSAPGLVKVALTSNVALTAAAKEQQSVTLAAGDLVLLTGQTSASENGVYTVSSIPESESSVALTRASSLDSAEEFASGSFVFVEKGTQAGQGYVLAEVASDFALGTSSVSYSQFTIDASALGDVSAGSVAASGLNVSGTATMSSGLSVSGGILDAQIVEADMLSLSNSPYGPTRIDGFFNDIYGERLTLFHPMGTSILGGDLYVETNLTVSGTATMGGLSVSGGLSVMSGDTTLSGNLDVSGIATLGSVSSLNVSGTATMSSGLTVSGGVLDAEIVDADMLSLSNSPYGPTRIDGMINEINGERLMLFHPMGTYIDGGLDVMFGDTTLGGNLTVSGNATVGNVAASGLDVSGATTLGSVSASGAADFSSASSVTVPEPSADSEAATKLYVDAALDTVSAPGLVKVALTSNVALTAAAKEQQSVTLAAGDLVLLTGQTSASENGVYTVSSIPESESSVALTRASSLDSAEEFASGSFVFVEKGTQAGQGYVLAEVASDFALGTSSVSYSQFTIDASALGDSIASAALYTDVVTGDAITAAALYTDASKADATTAAALYTDVVTGDAIASAALYTDYSMSEAIISARAYTDVAEADAITAAALYTDYSMSEATISARAYTDVAEADAITAAAAYTDAALDTVSAPGLVKVALTSNVALTAAAKEQQSVTLAAGDLVLLTGQTSASENGVYTVSSIPESESSVALTRASSLDSAEEFASGSFVFVEKGTQAGQGYVLAEVASDFALGTSSVSYSQFTIDASALGDVSAGSVAASGLNVSGTATMSNGLSVSGGVLDAQIVEADLLYLDGPNGSTFLDGFYNRIYGDRLTLNHPIGTIIEGGDLYVASNLNVSGTATMSGDLSVSGIVVANAFESSSDYRFKDNIKTITGAVEKVKQLRGVEYTLKSNGKDSVGVIAQEVEEVYPQLVSTSDERLGVKDAKSVNYSSLIGVLIEAVKEQQSQIEALKTQVNELQEDNTNTENTSTNLVVLGANN